MADDQTTAAPAPGIDYSALTPEMVNALIARATQPLPNIQPDQTPVDHSGFWGGLRHGISLLGEFAGSPGPEALKTLSPAEREQAGFQALSRFGTGLMAASHYVPGQTLGSNLAQGFQAAERGYDTTARQAAGLLGAQQDYAVKNQQADLAKLKEVIPLLQMQVNQRAVAGVPYTVGGGGKPGTPPPGTSIATGGSIAPFVAKNLPEDVTSAEDQIVRTVLGEAGNQPLEGQQGVAAVIKNRMEAGKQTAQDVIFAPNQFEPWNNPKTRAGLETIDPASKAYQDVLNNAVRPVMSGSAKDPTGGATHFWSPTAQAALGREPPSWAAGQTPTVIGQHNFYKLPYGASQGQAAPGQTSAPGQTAMAPVGTQPPNTPVTIPPAALPAPVQTAGPGAPTALAAPPGQTTIEPETGAPVVMPSTPGSGPPAFRYTPSQIPPGLIPSGTFTPEQQQAVKTIQDAYVHERQVALTPADVQKAESNFGTNMTKVLGSQTDAAKVATDALLKFHEADFTQQRDTHAKMLDDYLKQQQAEQQQRNELARIAATANEARTTAAAGSENAYVLDERKRFGTERDSARTNIDDLQMLSALSQAAGTSTSLDNIRVGDKTGRDYMANIGLGTQAQQQKWGAQQAFEAAVNKTVTGLRQGIAMGQLSDRDMAFIQHMAPSLMQNPQTRADIIGYLEQAQYRKLQYADAVEQLWDGGKGMSWGQAKREAQKQLPDYVPKVPGEYSGWDVPTRKAWLQSNARPGQLMRGPDGRLSIYQPGGP